MSEKLSFTKESILKAIENIKNNPSHLIGRESQIYDLVYKNDKYPPILVLSEANKLLGGSELTIRDFNNSTLIAFRHLKDLGFSVERKTIEYYEEINKFLNQAKTNDLRISDYSKNLLSLSIKVSFGQGVQARIPWIAFLGYGNTVQEGIYPVYLFYKERNLLILAYGVSETYQPKDTWKAENLTTVNQYFENNKLGKPERYHNSFIYRVYDVTKELNRYEINTDLQELIYTYHDIYKDKKHPNKSDLISNNEKSIVEAFATDLDISNLQFNKDLVSRFICSLIAKPFVLLTGLSGSGKTKIAQAFANWICEDKSQFCIIPVGADWTNREPLLGFPNALKNDEYVKPDNPTLDVLISSYKNSDKPHFLILDEMNLSHVERYFADFLSTMESKSRISLHSSKNDLNGVPKEIYFPENLFLIGTVNIDETTYMFSPKVLDRANVIEFNVTSSEMKEFLEDLKTPTLSNLTKKGTIYAQSLINYSKDFTIKPNETSVISRELIYFFDELKKTGAEFGYRSASEIYRLIGVINLIEKDRWSINAAVDVAIMQKLLPKIHGSKRKLEPVLKSLASLCFIDPTNVDKVLDLNESETINNLNKIKYPVSYDKIQRMYKNLISNSFTSYAEA